MEGMDGCLSPSILFKGMDAMSFDNLMQSFANQQQLGELEVRDNRYYFTIDSQMEIACFQANGKFYVYGVVAMLPKDGQNREVFILDILQKNLALLMTERVSLCIEPDQDALAIYLCRPLQGLNVDVVEEAIATLVNNFEMCIKFATSGQLSRPAHPSMFMP